MQDDDDDMIDMPLEEEVLVAYEITEPSRLERGNAGAGGRGSRANTGDPAAAASCCPRGDGRNAGATKKGTTPAAILNCSVIRINSRII